MNNLEKRIAILEDLMFQNRGPLEMSENMISTESRSNSIVGKVDKIREYLMANNDPLWHKINDTLPELVAILPGERERIMSDNK